MKKKEASLATATKKKSDFGMSYTELNRLVKVCGESRVSEITLPNGARIVFHTEAPEETVANLDDNWGQYEIPLRMSEIDQKPDMRNNSTDTNVEEDETRELLHADLLDIALSDPEQYESLVSEQMSRDTK